MKYFYNFYTLPIKICSVCRPSETRLCRPIFFFKFFYPPPPTFFSQRPAESSVHTKTSIKTTANWMEGGGFRYFRYSFASQPGTPRIPEIPRIPQIQSRRVHVQLKSKRLQPEIPRIAAGGGYRVGGYLFSSILRNRLGPPKKNINVADIHKHITIWPYWRR